DGEPVSAREVAAYTAMHEVAISRALSRLVAAGRVARRTDDGDQRRALLGLTAKGWEVHARAAPRARAHGRAVPALLNGEERGTLERILDKLLGDRETGDRRRDTKS